jgi:hypothetical protein
MKVTEEELQALKGASRIVGWGLTPPGSELLRGLYAKLKDTAGVVLVVMDTEQMLALEGIAARLRSHGDREGAALIHTLLASHYQELLNG